MRNHPLRTMSPRETGSRRRTTAALLGSGLAAALLLAGVGPASALSTRFAVELTTVSSDGLDTGLHVGDVVRGTFSHVDCGDPARCELAEYLGDVDETGGLYVQATVSIDLQLGPYRATSGGPGAYYDEIEITNLEAGDSYEWDVYQLAGGWVSPEPEAFPGIDIWFIDYWTVQATMYLRDDDGESFDDGWIPAELPPLDGFETATFSFQLTPLVVNTDGLEVWGPDFIIAGNVVALPEPSSGLLVGLGLVGLGLRRRRDRRR